MHVIYDSTIPKNELTTTDDMHHIPYQKRHAYRPNTHAPKNGKLRARDIPRGDDLFEDIDNVTVSRIKFPPRVLMDWDTKYSRKYDGTHVSWKNDKRNKRQWMTHKPAHKNCTRRSKREIEEGFCTVALEGRSAIW